MPRATRLRPAADEIGPTPERLRRRDIERVDRAIADEAGRPARPYRGVDTLTQMLRRRTISSEMYQAAEDFRVLFHAASLDPLRVPDLSRARGGGLPGALSPTESQAAARRKLWTALQAVGGVASPGGSCVWHVVGEEWSVRDWAGRQGWAGRTVSPEAASGILVAALGALQAHWEFDRTRKA
jgi:hypothetical protein